VPQKEANERLQPGRSPAKTPGHLDVPRRNRLTIMYLSDKLAHVTSTNNLFPSCSHQPKLFAFSKLGPLCASVSVVAL
jgi:hypothetical protein